MSLIRLNNTIRTLFIFCIGLGIFFNRSAFSQTTAQSPQIQAGISAQGFISSDSPTQDWLFESTEEQDLTILVNQFSGDLDPTITVLDSEGEVIAENDDRIPNLIFDAGIASLSFAEDETYTIQVGGSHGAGDYRLWLVPGDEHIWEAVSFDGNASRWDGRFAQHQTDSLVLHTEEQGVRSVYTSPEGIVPISDFYLQAEFEWLTGQDDIDATVGLVIRSTDNSTQRPSGYYFLTTPDGRWSVQRFQDGTFEELQPFTSSALLSSERVALGVHAQNSTFQFFANGQLLGEFRDSTFDEGDWGFTLENTTLPISIQVDNVLLTVPETTLPSFPRTIETWQSPQPADIANELASENIIREDGRRALTILSTSYQIAGLRTAFYSQGQQGLLYTNLVMGVDVQFEGDNLACGLGLRQNDESNQVLAYADIDGGAGLVDIIDGLLRHNTYDFYTEVDEPLPDNKVRLLVIAEGDWIALYVNGQLFDTQFSPTRRGQAGVTLLNYSTSVGRCLYSDFWVWQS